MQKLYVVNESLIRHTLQVANELFKNLPSTPFRSRETHYSSQQLRSFVQMGLLKVVAQEKELREVPLNRYERNSGEIALYDAHSDKRINNLNEIEKGRFYEAKTKDTKQVEAYYNIYQLTFSNYGQVVQSVRNELSEIYRDIK